MQGMSYTHSEAGTVLKPLRPDLHCVGNHTGGALSKKLYAQTL